MKMKEFIDIMNQSKNKALKAEQRQELAKKTLEVKNYMSIKDKKQLVRDIVNECILYENGMFKFNDIDKYICFTMKTIEAYTNLELSEDIEEDYDALCEHGLLNAVIETFHGEYDNVKVLLQMKCDNILSANTIEAQLGRFIDGLYEKIDDFANALSNLDVSKLPINMETLMNFINTQQEIK